MTGDRKRRRGRGRRRRWRRWRTAAGTAASVATRGPDPTAFRGAVPDSPDAAREAPLEAPLRRGRHLGPVHRVRRLRDRVPARRARLPRRRGHLPAVPARGRLRARQLQPRREGLHVVHPGLPAVPGLGARDRRVPLRAGPRPPTSRRASTRTSCSPGRPTRCWPRSARTAGSSRRSSCTRSSTTSSTPRS